jgi:adenylate cyclase
MLDSFRRGRLARALPPGTARLHVVMFAVSCLVLTGAVVTANALNAFRRLDLDTVDVRFDIRGQQPKPHDISVVAIDDDTFNVLGVRWPFPRRLHARVIDALRQAGAKAIVYDVQFTEQTDPRDDNALIDAVGRARNVVLATTQVDARGHTNVLGGDAVLRQLHARAGNALLPNDPGGVLRRVAYSVGGLKTLSVQAAEVATGRPVPRSKFNGRPAWIDYRGLPGRFDTISYWRVLRHRFDPRLVRGKIVVVGPTSASLQDVHPTPMSSTTLMSGPEVQANAISTVLRGLPLHQDSRSVDIVLIVLLGLVGPLTAFRFGALRSILLVLAVGGVFAVAAQLSFNSGLIISFVYPLASLILGGVSALAIDLVLTAFERTRVRDMFARFVPSSVVDEVLAKTSDGLRLGGEARTVTVLFSDVRGFTTYSETRSPEEVIEVLNRYLGSMSDVVQKHGGTLISYMGDGIMAVFGAPIEQEDHADRALATAREMTGEALEDFNAWFRENHEGEGFRIGVGLNSGPVMAGNVGSERRLEYTTIGDTTNTAARLEGMTKGTPHMVFLSDSTRTMLAGPTDGLVPVAEMEVRGRSRTISVWSLDDGSAPRGEPGGGRFTRTPDTADAPALLTEAPAGPEDGS